MKMFLIPDARLNLPPFQIPEFLRIGSDPENELILTGEKMRPFHARIENTPKGYLLRDISMVPGTFLNKTQILEAYLKEGDLIQIGGYEIRVEGETVFFNDVDLKSRNPVWNEQLSKIPFISRSDLPVMLLGASGTGKEVLSNIIHRHSYRRHGPFVSVNCGALSESLVESELFGHIRGSFTGSTQDRRGAFEVARGGTLFLDEIGDLPQNLQPKLLRALENHEIRPVGSDQVIKTNVRIISATHRNLKELIARGCFRSDLYFRLNVVQVKIPSLRERMEDFEKLIFQFAKEYKVQISQQAIVILAKHGWPGNIRELRNLVSRTAAIYPNERLYPGHLENLIDILPHETGSSTTSLKELEKETIKIRLVANRGNQKRTALDLGIARSTLSDRIRQYDINVPALLKSYGIAI